MIREISATELKSRLDAHDDRPFLLDVREPTEFAFCRIESSVLIPLGELPGRAQELPTDRDIVAICHHGNRSFSAAAWLQQSLGLSAISLRGGVAAWASEVDPTMKQY
ncbi:MAG: rhodanese-like domain-containing protein [Betaproteobacteria bacterium]